ncbi:hypothetical protein D3C78_962780 [compost metagenome]
MPGAFHRSVCSKPIYEGLIERGGKLIPACLAFMQEQAWRLSVHYLLAGSIKPLSQPLLSLSPVKIQMMYLNMQQAPQ